MLDRLRHVMFKFPIQQAVPENNDLSSWPCVIRDTKRIGYKVMTKIDTTLLSRIEKALLNEDHILETSKLSTSPKSGTTMKEVDEKITHVISDTLLCAWKDMQLVS